MINHIRLTPLTLSLAAVPLWCGQAFAQESAAPPAPTPSASPQAEVKIQTPNVREEHGKTQRVTFLGVHTSTLPEAVAAQLPLEKGTGLLVTFVAKDSPAEKAGLEPNDVLVKLNEHILVNTPQLQTVIENRKEGDAALVSFYHKGEEKTVTATLAAQEKSAGHHGFDGEDWGNFRTAEFQADLAKAQAEAQRAMAEAQVAVESARGEVEKHKGDWAAGMATLKDALKGVELPSDGSTMTFAKPGSAKTVTVDSDGVFVLNRKNNAIHLHAVDKTGKVHFDGDVSTPQAQSKVPPELSAKLQKLLKDFPSDTEPSAPPAPPAPPAAPAPAAPAAPAPPAA